MLGADDISNGVMICGLMSASLVKADLIFALMMCVHVPTSWRIFFSDANTLRGNLPSLVCAGMSAFYGNLPFYLN